MVFLDLFSVNLYFNQIAGDSYNVNYFLNIVFRELFEFLMLSFLFLLNSSKFVFFIIFVFFNQYGIFQWLYLFYIFEKFFILWELRVFLGRGRVVVFQDKRIEGLISFYIFLLLLQEFGNFFVLGYGVEIVFCRMLVLLRVFSSFVEG